VGDGKKGAGYWLAFTGSYQRSIWEEENVNQKSSLVMVI
jgi:hypothetical protein